MYPYYVVDAFTQKLFAGNPAGVCLPASWPDDAVMQSIAAENNLPETAFAVKNGQDFDLRWFTPEAEIDLCGHATLATAFILGTMRDTAAATFRFHTKSGLLTVDRKDNGLWEMDFPSRPPQAAEITAAMREAVGVTVKEAHQSRDLLLLLESEEAVRSLAPDMDKIKALPGVFGVMVTARGESGADFVSRFFVPGAGIPEDPVTGSTHSTLIPFWAARLGKQELLSHQLSRRGGVLYCRNAGDRVKIAGHAALYLEGSLRAG